MDFSEKYKKKEFYWGTKPNIEVVSLLKHIKLGDVLDVGIGEGKNAVFLATKGFNVEGIDNSNEGLEKVKKLAAYNNVIVKTHCVDVKDFRYRKKYDWIMSTFTLHYLPKKESRRIIRRIKEFTKVQGINLITVFTKDVPDYSPEIEKKFGLDLFEKEELKNLYQDWEIVKYTEKTKLDNSHGKQHYHTIALLIAKKVV